MRARILVIFILIVGVLTVSKCDYDVPSNENAEKNLTYAAHLDSTQYVGIDVCKQCHYDKYETFLRTGMGSSFGDADTNKSIAELDPHSSIYDEYLNYHYHPHWHENELHLEEYRLNGNDTIHSLKRKVDYVVGSGQHTNSHIYNENGYLYQLPFTWYAQKGKLDLPPGYENGANTRFNRIIGLECMSCHNAMPTTFVKGSSNKFKQIPQGIDCERCHGPGGAHVQKVQSGDLTDTSKYIDYSIVNPKKLDVQLQFELCQRCHLQGNMVLAEGKSFFDFKPGMNLNEVMDVYLPKFDGAEDQFIMASHVDRFKESKCFKQSEDYTCTSCHNPHVSVKETKVEKFNQQCQNCHKSPEALICSAKKEELDLAQNNCVSCHMPSSGSIDIPHVTVHDHYVRKPSIKVDTSGIGRFIGLVAINNPKPDNRSKALAYMQQFERFNEQTFLLDSALRFLFRHDPLKVDDDLWVHYHYLREGFENITEHLDRRGDSVVLDHLKDQTFDNRDAWTAYRIGEALMKRFRTDEAAVFYERAVFLAPFVPNFKNKYGVALLKLRDYSKAQIQFEGLLKESPSHREGLNNLGYCYLTAGDLIAAEKYFKKAIEQDPDYLLAWLNLSNVYLQSAREKELRETLQEVLRIDPQHETANQLIKRLG